VATGITEMKERKNGGRKDGLEGLRPISPKGFSNAGATANEGHLWIWEKKLRLKIVEYLKHGNRNHEEEG